MDSEKAGGLSEPGFQDGDVISDRWTLGQRNCRLHALYLRCRRLASLGHRTRFGRVGGGTSSLQERSSSPRGKRESRQEQDAE